MTSPSFPDILAGYSREPVAHSLSTEDNQSGRTSIRSTARLLNNMLSVDKVRATAAGRGLMWLKDASTALELGFSPFHAVFETIEAASSQMALRPARAGYRHQGPSPLAPIALAREGAALPAYIEARARLAKIGTPSSVACSLRHAVLWGAGSCLPVPGGTQAGGNSQTTGNLPRPGPTHRRHVYWRPDHWAAPRLPGTRFREDSSGSLETQETLT
jgi:hypothetical protein